MMITKSAGLFLMLSVLFLFSCSKDKVDCEDTMAVNLLLSSEVQSLNNSIAAYNVDPTDSSLCKDLRNAYDDLIDVLRDVRECFDATGQQQIDQDINQATQSRNSLTC